MNWVRAQWDRVCAGLAIAIGLICLFFGYIGVSNKEYVAAQLPYLISGGIGGIFFLGVGAMFWLSADLRDEWREMRGARVILSRVDTQLENAALGVNPGEGRSRGQGNGRPDNAAAGAGAHRASAGATRDW